MGCLQAQFGQGSRLFAPCFVRAQQPTRSCWEAEAFRFIQRQAMERRLSMKQVAEQVVERLGS
jgi:hypothetical protein